MNISEFRKQYPDYNDIPDQELAEKFYQKHYSDMPKADFLQKFLGSAMPQQAQPQNMTDPMAESMGMFSPTQAAKGAQMFAPEIGATAGGLIGSRIPIPGAAPFLTGMGYAGGEAVKSGEMPSLDQFTQNFGKGAAMELGAKPLSWLASKAFAPIKQGFQMLRAGQLADKGLPIPASAISPTEKGLKLAEKARSTYPGNTIVQKAHEKLRTGSKEMLTEFEKKMGVNEFSKEAADNAFESWATHMGGGEAPLALPKSQQYIAETLEKPFVTEANKSWWKEQAGTFMQNPTVQGLRDIWATLGIKGAKGLDKTARVRFAEIAANELKEGYGPEAAQLLDFAKNQNTWWKKVSNLQGIIKRSHATVDGVDTFMPDRFAREWLQAKNKFNMKAKFTDDELAQIDEFADFMGVIGSELGQKVSKKSFGVAEALPILGTLGGAATNPKAIPLAALGAIPPALSARAGQIFKPGSGIYKKMLGDPSMASEIIPGVVNIGGKLILMKGLEK